MRPVNSMNALFLILFEFLLKDDLEYSRAALSKIYSIPNLNLQDLRVLFISIVMVMGPTPPGTGVI